MNCGQVSRLSTAYLDGELKAKLSAALRGHLRVCAPCHQLVTDEEAIRNAAESLEPVEPATELWSSIDAELAAIEVAEAKHATWSIRVRDWLATARGHALPLTVCAVAICTALVWTFTRTEPVADSAIASAIRPARNARATFVKPPASLTSIVAEFDLAAVRLRNLGRAYPDLRPSAKVQGQLASVRGDTSSQHAGPHDTGKQTPARPNNVETVSISAKMDGRWRELDMLQAQAVEGLLK